MGKLAQVFAGLALVFPTVVQALPACPAGAGFTVYVRNLSADPQVTVALDGELVDVATTCTGTAPITYAGTFTCAGSGLVPCGRIEGVRPGAWVHRLAVTVAGSDQQVQAQRSVLLAAESGNAITWTIYPRTFVVRDATQTEFLRELSLASTFAASGSPALITFSRAKFPGAASPQTITFDETTRVCDPDGHNCASIRMEGSHLVIDALDARGQPGGVVLSVGIRRNSLLRLLGGDDVLRGLVLQGSQSTDPLSQYDTVAISGAAAQGDRLEQCIVRGPTMGDGIGLDGAAGGGTGAVVVDRCEITGAKDKGIKSTFGSHVDVRRSCVHDNANGGIQSSLGGHVETHDNLVQHNRPGAAQNGISVGGDPGGTTARSTLASNGDIVRFAGSRGLSVNDNADATFTNVFVGDGQFAGARVETTVAGVAPGVKFRGVAFVCNKKAGITGVCRPQLTENDLVCATADDCCGPGTEDPDCTTGSVCNPVRVVDGVGAVSALVCPGCATPIVDYGTTGDPGRNAFVLNAAQVTGANLKTALPTIDASFVVPAVGNQWEHCGPGASCNTADIAARDLLVGGGSVDIGTPENPRLGAPAPASHSPERPAAGDIVRIFGTGFNAFEGAACAPGVAPSGPCAIDDPNVMAANACPRNGNCVQVTMGGQTSAVPVSAVTPTMIAFRMPFDCFAPATIHTVRQGLDSRTIDATIPFCDAAGCLGRSQSDPCEDGNLCTVGDHCSGTGNQCVPGNAAHCGGPCLTGTCDPTSGCVPVPATTACDDGDPCTVGDHCSGVDGRCVSGTDPCASQCLTGTCGVCSPLPATTACDDGDACTVDDHCSGDGACVAGQQKSCDDGDACTDDVCVGAGECRHDALERFDAITCRAVILGRAASPPMHGAQKLGNLAQQVAFDANAAREAESERAFRRALRRLARTRAHLHAALGVIRASQLPAADVQRLRDVAKSAIAAANSTRQTIVDEIKTARAR